MTTPDPIAEESLHVAWLSFGVTVWAIVIALIGAVLAGWALAVAIKDARRNATQLAIALRSPDLHVSFYDEPHSASQFGMGRDGTKTPIIPRTLAVRNAGSRTSHHVRIELLIQRNAVLRESISPQDDAIVRGTRFYRVTSELPPEYRLYHDAPPSLISIDEIGFCRVKEFSPETALIREAETLMKQGSHRSSKTRFWRKSP